MGDLAALEKARRENARWRILKILDAGRPVHVNEQLILLALRDSDLDLTPTELRREIDYLEHRKMVMIHERDKPVWLVELLRLGIDVIEGTVECEAGIAKPPEW